jgi:hypothetical protein
MKQIVIGKKEFEEKANERFLNPGYRNHDQEDYKAHPGQYETSEEIKKRLQKGE